MTEFPATLLESILVTDYGRPVAPFSHPAPPFVTVVDDPAPLEPDGYPVAPGFQDVGMKSQFADVEWPAVRDDRASIAIDWFEMFHVLPRTFHLGNLLTTQQVSTEVYSAFRRTREDWVDWIDNVGPGVDLDGEPSLPVSVPPQTGFVFDLIVTTDAPPVVNTTLDFVFSTGTILIPISFRIVLLITAVPEAPYDEDLEFLTDVLRHRDASEQRIALRLAPRQFFDVSYILDEGEDRNLFDFLLFDWQERAFGLGLWHEGTRTTAAASVGAFTLNVKSTASADYRVGGLAVVYTDARTFDVLVIASIGGTSLTFESPTQFAYAARTVVAPLRVVMIDGPVRGGRWRVNLSRFDLRLRVIEAGVDLADLGSTPTYKGRPLLDDCNIVEGFLSEEFEQEVIVLDGGTGLTEQYSDEDRNQRVTPKTFLARGAAQLWAVRRLMHLLRGRQGSFYMPTFGRDLEPIAALASASSVFSVRNDGYASLIRQRVPRGDVWIRLVDGTTILREVVDSVVIDEDEEQLTVDAPWASTVQVADIDRISFLELRRFDSDTIRIQHTSSAISLVGGPTRTVKA